MADTIPDIRLSGVAFEDIYALSNIGVGTSIIIQNKQSVAVYVQVSASQPHRESRDGYLLIGNESCIVKGDISGVWAFGTSKILVQVME